MAKEELKPYPFCGKEINTMKQITKEWLKKHDACARGFKFWCENCEKLSTEDQIRKLGEENFTWADWLIVRMMTYKQYVSYTEYAAESVLHIFEEQFPNDISPRKAIELVNRCIQNPGEEYVVTGDIVTYMVNAAYATMAAIYAGSVSELASVVYSADPNLKSKLIVYGIKLLRGKNEKL